MNYSYFVTDIKLASILIGLGIPKRENQPITCEVVEKQGRDFKLYKFWFDIQDAAIRQKCKTLVEAYANAWEKLDLDVEHPLYYMKGALDNREAFLDWIRRDVQPMKTYKIGGLTVTMSTRASEATKEKVKKYAREML